MADPVTEGHDAENLDESAPGSIQPPAGNDGFSEVDADPDEAHAAAVVPAAAIDPATPPHVYPPDPAGTRPKVAPTALEPSGRSSSGLVQPLGRTFRPPAGGSAAAAAAATAAVDEAPRPPVESPHAPRFQFILGALLALGLSAIAITAYTLGSGRDPLPTDWSTWHPTASGIAAATQIANHVAAEYRQPGGQLLAVQGGPLAFDGVPVTAIALKTGAGAAGISVLAGNAVLYKMCGLGPSCSIAGKASAERLTLVRREALELALYTFQYVGGANQVVVFLPPVLHPATVPGQPKKVKVTTDPTDAVFFKASDLAGELSHPLTSTLTQAAPNVTTVAAAPDTPAVEELTSPSFYKFSFEQTTQDASLFLVLEPFAVGN
jgi:hypothetical protein